MRLLFSTAIAIVMASSAVADTTTYYRSGAWENYAGWTDKKEYVCGMSINSSNSHLSLHIKYFPNSKFLGVFAFSDSWRIPKDTKMAVNVGFDNEFWGGIDNAIGDTMTTGSGYRIGVV